MKKYFCSEDFGDFSTFSNYSLMSGRPKIAKAEDNIDSNGWQTIDYK